MAKSLEQQMADALAKGFQTSVKNTAKAAPKPKITTPDNTAFGLADIGFQNAAKNASSQLAASKKLAVDLAAMEEKTNLEFARMDEEAAQVQAAMDELNRLYIEGIKAESEADKLRLQKEADALRNQLRLSQIALGQKTPTATADELKASKEANDIMVALTAKFTTYGLASLIPKIKELAISGVGEETIKAELANTEEYKLRFSANQDRLKKNLSILSPAEYLAVEDGYRQTLRAYGLTQFDNDAYVKQFIVNDISPTELSNRVVMAVQRVRNADPAIQTQLKDYYGIGDTDLVAYVLDPAQQFQKIQRQVAAAEIGVAAGRQGLQAGVNVAEQLAAQGITQAEAQKGYATIADILPTAEKLSSIYGTTMEGYDQSKAEQEVFNSLASAQRARQKLTAREIAQFSGSSGMSKASLSEGKTAGQI
jgi:hypothetical protein